MHNAPVRTPHLLLGLVLLMAMGPTTGHAAVRPGVEVGVNVSSLSYDDDSYSLFDYWDRGWLTSFTGGASLEIPFQERLSLVTGLRYVRQGNRVKYDTTPSGTALIGEFRVIQDYISVPVLLAVRPFPTRRLVLSLGPEVAYLLSAQLMDDVTTSFIPAPVNEFRDIRDELETANLTLDAGAAYEFPMENHVGVVGVRYTHGLIGVANEDYWISNWKTRGIETLIGMRW